MKDSPQRSGGEPLDSASKICDSKIKPKSVRLSSMRKIISKFSSFNEAQKADDEYYMSLTPTERVEIVLELQARHREGIEDGDEASGRFSRVYKVVKFS